jgi:hypothetical protein
VYQTSLTWYAERWKTPGWKSYVKGRVAELDIIWPGFKALWKRAVDYDETPRISPPRRKNASGTI